MSKLNYSKAEKKIDNALKTFSVNQSIDQMLTGLCELKKLTETPDASIDFSHSLWKNNFKQLQEKLSTFKKQTPLFYQKLNLTEDEENLLTLSPIEMTAQAYLTLAQLKDKLDQLKKDISLSASFKGENEKQVTTERKKHLNKRINVREGWLPLK